MSNIKLTLPPLAEGQTGWDVYGVTPQYKDVPDTRKWHERAIYNVMMWAHDKAELFWHWCYYKSRRFAPPQPKIDYKYTSMKVGNIII